MLEKTFLGQLNKEPDWTQRIAFAAGVVLFIVASYGVIYQWIMATFEGRPITYFQALQVVIESLTTAGFGGHAPWESAIANLFVLAMNLSGVALVFLGVPLFATPLIRQLLERRPPASSDLENHIIVCGYSEKDEVVRRELEEFERERGRKIPFLYVEPDPERVRDLVDRGIHAIVGDPESVETLRAANAEKAKAIVADVDDETNPSVTLAAKLIDKNLPVLSVVRNRRVASHHKYAGADRVIKARQSFGKSLAIRAASSYAKKFRDVVKVKEGVEVTELVIEDGCRLIGKTLAEANLSHKTRGEANVIAAWVGGKFLISPAPDTPIRKNAILVVAGKVRGLDISGIHAIPGTMEESHKVVIGGFGTVGRTVYRELKKAGIETTVIDVSRDREKVWRAEEMELARERAEAGDGQGTIDLSGESPIDIIGDITDEATLRKAKIDEADAVVISLDRDIPTMYATIIINHLAPDVEIIARADEAGSISTLYQAGADFVLSLTTVTGEILASELLDILGEKGGFLPASTEFRFTRVNGGIFSGKPLMELDLRNKTGCTVAAVERDGAVLTNVLGDFYVEDDDTLIVTGSHDSIEKFCNEYLPEWIAEHAEPEPEPEPEDTREPEPEPEPDEGEGEGEGEGEDSKE